jgi:hypothetical protein
MDHYIAGVSWAQTASTVGHVSMFHRLRYRHRHHQHARGCAKMIAQDTAREQIHTAVQTAIVRRQTMDSVKMVAPGLNSAIAQLVQTAMIAE